MRHRWRPVANDYFSRAGIERCTTHGEFRATDPKERLRIYQTIHNGQPAVEFEIVTYTRWWDRMKHPRMVR